MNFNAGTSIPILSEAEFEKLVDRAVMRRLGTDRAYRNAENAEAQATREQEIEDEEIARLDTIYGTEE